MSATVTPISDQRAGALAKANRIRFARADKMRELRALPMREGCLMAATVLEESPEYLASATAFYLLTQVHRMGQSIARKMLVRTFPHNNAEALKIGTMTPRQRSKLAAALRYRAGDYGALDRSAA